LKKEGLVVPDFKNSNMEVVRQLAEGKGRFTGQKSKKIFLLIDGLGYNFLMELMKKSPEFSNILKDAEINKATTIFPSFTITVISSLDSGLTVCRTRDGWRLSTCKETGHIIRVLDGLNEWTVLLYTQSQR